MTPLAEFNTYADSVAAARVFALTSPNPRTTLPPVLHGKHVLPAYPEKLSRQLKLKLFPLGMHSPLLTHASKPQTAPSLGPLFSLKHGILLRNQSQTPQTD
jgi:hypothetical protein